VKENQEKKQTERMLAKEAAEEETQQQMYT
jgi:hypothetical protein